MVRDVFMVGLVISCVRGSVCKCANWKVSVVIFVNYVRRLCVLVKVGNCWDVAWEFGCMSTPNTLAARDKTGRTKHWRLDDAHGLDVQTQADEINAKKIEKKACECPGFRQSTDLPFLVQCTVSAARNRV